MSTSDQNYSVSQADTHVLAFTATSGGNAINLTGALQLKWTLSSKRKGDPTPILTKTLSSGVSVTNAAAGQFTVTVDNGDLDDQRPGYYYHEVFFENSANQKFVIATGWLTLTPAITKT